MDNGQVIIPYNKRTLNHIILEFNLRICKTSTTNQVPYNCSHFNNRTKQM